MKFDTLRNRCLEVFRIKWLEQESNKELLRAIQHSAAYLSSGGSRGAELNLQAEKRPPTATQRMSAFFQKPSW